MKSSWSSEVIRLQIIWDMPKNVQQQWEQYRGEQLEVLGSIVEPTCMDWCISSEVGVGLFVGTVGLSAGQLTVVGLNV